MIGDPIEDDGRVLPDHRAEDSAPGWQMPDDPGGGLVDSFVDELRDHAVLAQDPEGCVAGTRGPTGFGDQTAQQFTEVGLSDDRGGRGDERRDAVETWGFGHDGHTT
jgi:hypothetical protein